MKFNENPRTIDELKSLPELEKLRYEIFTSYGLTIVIPNVEVNTKRYSIFKNVLISLSINYLYWGHVKKSNFKYTVNLMRNLYNNFPLKFGYSIRHPSDPDDTVFGLRVALERLVIKLNKK